ncbi:MAG: 23S rRNA (pseudouridine(1915)-N(3))-methyltransferase RlmH [Gammaproteobacteria bacterium]|nr:23S rRNA (pseudouridine(1915)-N(3))-methyltransferase RlmH [Pseudomonadota bacterium]MCZ6537895.1 23S rRNA (pseudouridine(1915)-N(3))-methyltransferase RlmH [Gammaproteobacteria bacterium]MCZ6686441.1 23S rRNA (pseudouridine(1915)-N(3))-methyltransferase RlmH [Gammaproteobacteria bacterium]MCZ6762000.1 23S rRNA (pseudouridine(1915)-N(3))-methyltransferase RlmH [Gammaproteobacteria bacterium]
MRLTLIAAGTRMPAWVEQGYQEYARRLGGDCRLELVEIPLGLRTRRSTGDRAKKEEGERMLRQVAAGDRVIALEVTGKSLDTEGLARCLEDWRRDGRNVALLIGGPDGLSAACLQKAEFKLSLSALTLPHGMVRVLLAEQIYRAWSLLHNHPYHRA